MKCILGVFVDCEGIGQQMRWLIYAFEVYLQNHYIMKNVSMDTIDLDETVCLRRTN